MLLNRNFPIPLRKNTVATALLILCATNTQAADLVTGTIYAVPSSASSGAGTTVDYYQFTLSQAANVEIDVLANEGYVNSWGSPPIAYQDLNHDGEITLADTQFRLYQDSVSLANEITSADDASAAFSLPGNTGGWGDGSLINRDSYLQTALDVGTYIIAFGDYSLTSQEAVNGFNAGDALTAATGINPFTGATGQNHFDYQISFNFVNFDTNQAFSAPVEQIANPGGFGLPSVTTSFTTPAAVPVPGAVWFFGTAVAGFSALRKRKKI